MLLQDEKKMSSHDDLQSDSGEVLGDLCAGSSDDEFRGTKDSSARARARGHGGGGFKSSLQSKFEKIWRKKGEVDDAPDEWQHMHESMAGTRLLDESEELVGDAYGMNDDGEDARVWGMHDEHCRGNVYKPGEEAGRARPPPKIIDRGSIVESSIAKGAANQDEDAGSAKRRAKLSDK